MLVANKIEESLKQLVEKKGQKGWMRSKECAREFAKDRIGHINPSEETKFYRWLKKVEKGKVEGFQVKKLPGNVSYVGLKSARFEDIEAFIEEDKKTKRSVTANLGFFQWLEKRAERKRLEQEQIKKEALAREWDAMLALADTYPDTFGFYKDWVQNEKKNRKE